MHKASNVFDAAIHGSGTAYYRAVLSAAGAYWAIGLARCVPGRG